MFQYKNKLTVIKEEIYMLIFVWTEKTILLKIEENREHIVLIGKPI